MRPRRAVLQTLAKSIVLHKLPLNNRNPLLTRSESTLPQLLIPLHFNFARINTYKKPGGGYLPHDHKVLQLVTPHLSPRCTSQVFSSFSPFNFKLSTFNASSPSPFPATLTSRPQIVENKTTLSPAVATLTDCVKHKSFVCHSCRKTPGVGYPRRASCGPAIVGRLSRLPHGTRVTAPMVHPYRCAPRRKVPESQLLLVGSAPGNISAPPVSNKRKSGHRVRHPQTAKPGRKSIPAPYNAGVARARRPGSTVPRCYKVRPTSRVARAS